MAHESKYGQIEIPGIPDDEPIFIIRAKDKAAPLAVLAYMDEAEFNGADPEFCKSVKEVSHAMEAWQKENPGLVKIPD